MPFACAEGLPTLRSNLRSARHGCGSALASRLPVCRRSFPAIPSAACSHEGEDAEQRFADFANDEPCPALDPQTGYCELYESRPMTCRVFGPPVRSEDGLGVCELCFQGASDEEIAACEMKPDPDDLESRLLAELEKSTGRRGNTIIAFCLAS